MFSCTAWATTWRSAIADPFFLPIMTAKTEFATQKKEIPPFKKSRVAESLYFFNRSESNHTLFPVKQIFAFILILIGCAVASAQTTPLPSLEGATKFHYQTYNYGTQIDTQHTTLVLNGDCYSIKDSLVSTGPFIPGYSTSTSVVDLKRDSLFVVTEIVTNGAVERFLTASPFTRDDIQFEKEPYGELTRYSCSINSNRLVFYVQEYPYDINPIPYYGRFKGLLVSFWRNGQLQMSLLGGAKGDIGDPKEVLSSSLRRVTSRELSNIKRDRMVITKRIFDDVQLAWGKPNSEVKGRAEALPYDSVFHFAGGTLALKKVHFDTLPAHYQAFAEIHQRSNGDAYDRTGSLFIIPDVSKEAFFTALTHHPDSLPIARGRDGQRYQGMRCETRGGKDTYQPPIELVRFFTSFGVGQFNNRVKIDGLEWEDENFYKQEVTDLLGTLSGETWVGIWIGNYDGGGHRVTVDLKFYPGSEDWNIDPAESTRIQSLFNTCNVLEMAGQNYGKIFGTDSLTAEFSIPEDATDIRLRYITTGHGGWEGGDEFNQRPNTILVDGKTAYTYTPWRCDCARYREWNPVSGNFWNGMSSSDYSRSGWCPGTATQPVYFDLTNLAPGKHTITIAIPQGAPQEGSFSYWSVSGVMLYNKASK